MLNSKIFPFERNRYYNGKLLTSKDFVCEQTYINDKRRLINRLLFDFGIVMGLNTYKIDEITICIESGVAIDHNGREIVIPQFIAKKLSAIANYEKIKENTFYLCLSYQELESQTEVNLLQSQNTEDERNRIEESYFLFLKEEDSLSLYRTDRQIHLFDIVLFEDDTIKIHYCFPKIGQRHKNILFKVLAENKNTQEVEIELQCRISVPGMISEKGNSYIDVTIEKVKISALTKIEFDYTGCILTQEQQNIPIRVVKEHFILFCNSIKKQTHWEKKESILTITDLPIYEEIIRRVQSTALTDCFRAVEEDYIVLAKIKITRLGFEYQIDNVEKNPYSLLVSSPIAQRCFEQLREYYPEEKKVQVNSIAHRQEDTESIKNVDFSKYLASGVIDIPIGLDAKAGSVVFSDETMHGLGRGAVNVSVSIEQFSENDSLMLSNETISGKTDIFMEKRARNNLNVETAVKVMNDRGTFVVGVRLLSWTDAISISIRWSAWKAPDSEKRFLPYDRKGASMVLSPDTVVIAPGETTVFVPVYSEMEPSPCTFELIDAAGGTIDSNGQYVACAKEGVYEIRATSVANPHIYATAFVVVKQKK